MAFPGSLADALKKLAEAIKKASRTSKVSDNPPHVQPKGK